MRTLFPPTTQHLHPYNTLPMASKFPPPLNPSQNTTNPQSPHPYPPQLHPSANTPSNTLRCILPTGNQITIQTIINNPNGYKRVTKKPTNQIKDQEVVKPMRRLQKAPEEIYEESKKLNPQESSIIDTQTHLNKIKSQLERKYIQLHHQYKIMNQQLQHLESNTRWI